MLCKINRKLKTIYIYDFDINMIESIYNILLKTNKRNVKLLIHQNLENTKNINDNMKKLKVVNKLLEKNCDSKMKIIYSVDYIRKNFVKQLSITNLKTCLLIVLVLEIVVFISVKLNNYKTKNTVNNDSVVSSYNSNIIDNSQIKEN